MPYKDPVNQAAARRRWRAAHPDRYAAIHRRNVKKNQRNQPDSHRSRNLQHLYGITLAQKQELYEQQRGLCAMCNQPLPEDYRQSAVDHCHVTNKVRGLLHKQPCNNGLGWIENAAFLRDALNYLAKHDTSRRE